MALTPYERETIISFNEEEPNAVIFTYSSSWKRHLEKELGLTPARENGWGGSEYILPKSRISMPRKPRKLSPEQRKKAGERLAAGRRSANEIAKTHIIIRKSKGNNGKARDLP